MYEMVGMRADLAFAVSTVSQFMWKVGSPHWIVVKRIMRYLKAFWTSNYALEARILP